MLGNLLPELRARRHTLGLSQASVAALAGMSQGAYSKMELGKHDPTLGTLADVARSLGLEVMLVPTELVATVNGMAGNGTTQEDRPLFQAEPD